MSVLNSRQSWVIKSTTTSTPMFWSKEKGWVHDQAEAWLFSDERKEEVNFPLAGVWVVVDQCRHERVEYSERHWVEFAVLDWEPETRRLRVDRMDRIGEDVDDLVLTCRDCGVSLDYREVG